MDTTTEDNNDKNKNNDQGRPKPFTTDEKEDDSPLLPKFVNCNGLRYAIPYDSTSKAMFVKHHMAGQTLDIILGTMFRRNRGMQPIEEAAAHWYSEIEAGRVQVRGPKRSREDPWEWKVARNHPRTSLGERGGGGEDLSDELLVPKGSSIRLQQHVHEKVVPAVAKIHILCETDKFIAIHKPAGLATVDEFWVSGVNSLMTLVREEVLSSRSSNSNSNSNSRKKQELNLQPAHRLDKPVSGVLLIGKSPGKAAKLLNEIHRATKGDDQATSTGAGGVKKVYVARVLWDPQSIALVTAQEDSIKINADVVVTNGLFPKQVTVEAELGWDSKNQRAKVMTDGGTEAAAGRASARKESMEGMERRDARKKEYCLTGKKDKSLRNTKKKKLSEPKGNDGDNDGDTPNNEQAGPPMKSMRRPRTHTTRFQRLGDTPQADGTFLVECLPLTGQRHQIRAHLAAIGWPIANDILYRVRLECIEDGANDDASTLLGTTKLCAYIDDEASTLQRMLGSPRVLRSWCTKCNWTMRMLATGGRDDTQLKVGDTELEKGVAHGKGDHRKVSPGLRRLLVESGIWLHSLRYVLPAAGLDIVAPLPDWAEASTAELGYHYTESDMARRGGNV